MADRETRYQTTDKAGLAILVLGGLCFLGAFVSVLLGIVVDESFTAYAGTFGKAFVAVLFGGFAVFFAVGMFLESRRGQVHLDLEAGEVHEPGQVIPVSVRFEVEEPQHAEEAYAQLICIPEPRHPGRRRREHRRLAYRARVDLARDLEVEPGRPWEGRIELTVPTEVRPQDGVRGPVLVVDGVDVAKAAGAAFGAVARTLVPDGALPERPEYPGMETREDIVAEANTWVRVRTREEQWRQRHVWRVEVIFRLDERCEKVGSERVRIVRPDGPPTR